MISDKHQCIFIHVPKCAGESVETVLLGKPFNISKYGGHHEKHWSIKKINESYPDKFASYYSFSVIRNPWERVVSWIKYRDIRWGRTTGTFESRLWNDLNDDVLVDFMISHSCVNLLFLNGRIGVDHVIRMENLKEGFAEVCDKLGMERVDLPHCNSTEHNAYTTYYDDRTRKRVADIFKADIQQFEYEF